MCVCVCVYIYMYTHTPGTLKLLNFISGIPPKKFENPCTVV